ncbi:hypothetical protein BJ875DRAFT_523113 [Amylocarpus encephaloides]|uniref:F-box domain-containing protein n=1 Tax=Amylocarpus encephaloides TaxID=45428 RepID=A0A9P8C1V1_9HELO|nr:hypothetical protein BJ875DRAFT_523113 [Amylocarpus encephaloides]
MVDTNCHELATQMLRDTPPEIASSICEYLERPDLRNVRLLNRVFDSAARRILFRTIFLKVNSLSFSRLSKISKNETLRHCVEVVMYDGRELDLSEIPDFEDWLHYNAARGIGLATLQKREGFLARFSQQQLQEYHFNFCRYATLAQEQISQEGNEVEWLREATRRFPRLSAIEYAESEPDPEYGRELQQLNLFSHMAQQILAEPDEGLGVYNAHFWALVRAVFCGQERPQQVKFAPNLCSFKLSHGDHPGRFHSQANFLPTKLFDKPLHWKYLKKLSLENLVLSPTCLQQLIQGHSSTPRSLELSDMSLRHGDETISGSSRALWIRMVVFLSQTLSLERVRLVGYFTTDTNEAWSTGDGFVSPPLQERCLLRRIEYFITHGGTCPFTPKTSATASDVDLAVSQNEAPWIPEHSWTWEEDDTWRFVALRL